MLTNLLQYAFYFPANKTLPFKELHLSDMGDWGGHHHHPFVFVCLFIFVRGVLKQ